MADAGSNSGKRNAVGRRPANISLDPRLVAEARELGVNLSRACERGLVAQLAEERARRWQEENAEAIASSNAYVEEKGLPLAEFRLF